MSRITEMDQRISEQTIGRLSLYRRLLDKLAQDGITQIYSHELAEKTRFTPAQVRRDLMPVGPAGNTRRGYDVAELIRSIDDYLDAPAGQQVAVVGIGNLGRALLTFFSARRPNLHLVAGFDINPSRVERVTHGCRIHHIDELADIVREQNITLVILSVPSAAAQAAADQCVSAGVRGILNFAPVPLRVPPTVYVSNVDLTMCLEMVAFFARQTDEEQGND
ncbi:MAG: redox-sensing transcriptional repressor Rex [Planctomycetota bacterium]